MQSQNTLIKSVKKEHLGTIDLGDGYPWKTASIDIVDFHLYRRETREEHLLCFAITFSAGDKKASLSISLEIAASTVIFKAGLSVDRTNRETKRFVCSNLQNKNDFSSSFETDEVNGEFYSLMLLAYGSEEATASKCFTVDPAEQLYDVYCYIARSNRSMFGKNVNVVSVSYSSNF